MAQRLASAGLFILSLFSERNTVTSISNVHTNTKLSGDLDSHINALSGVLPIVSDNVRKRKALLQTVDEHGLSGLSLIRARVKAVFHFHFSGVMWVPESSSVQEANVLDETD